MITKDKMFEPILTATPSFQPAWDEFVHEWENDPEGLPCYAAISDLARHIIALHVAKQLDEVKAVMDVLECWLLDGDGYVREAATVGLIEDLQNLNLHQDGTKPKDFVRYLGPESLYWWRKVTRFWEKGELLVDDRRKQRLFTSIFRRFLG